MNPAPLDSRSLDRAYRTARDALLAERAPDGRWIGELSSSALSTATAVSALAMVADSRRRLGEPAARSAGRDPDRRAADVDLSRLIGGGLDWIARHQNADGGWGDTADSPSNISTTMLVRAALYLAGASERYVQPLERAAAYVAHAGGNRAIVARYGKDRTFAVPILATAALAGLASWRDVPRLPFELAALPHAWFRFFRLHVVSYALPALIAIGQCIHVRRPPRNPITRGVRQLVRARTLRKLEAIQPSSGGFLEATPLTSFVTMSLAAIGQAEHPVARRAVEFLIRSARHDGSWPIDTNLSVWLTTLSVNALAAGEREGERQEAKGERREAKDERQEAEGERREAEGERREAEGERREAEGERREAKDERREAKDERREAKDERREAKDERREAGCDRGETTGKEADGGGLALSDSSAGSGHSTLDSRLLDWLLAAQYRVVHPYTNASPGGWGWSDLSGSVPDADDTAGALLALSHLPRSARSADAAMAGVHWLLDLQNGDGGWPTFCRGWGKLPFDRSGADLTAHALRALAAWRGHAAPGKRPARGSAAAAPRLAVDRALARGFEYLRRVQRPDGSWLPLWFGNQHARDDENPTYGTARVLLAYRALDRFETPEAVRARRWLVAMQNHDGGWGGAAGAPSTTEETGLAVETLAQARAAADEARACHRGAAWLVARVLSEDWRKPSPIGLYFAKLWYYERLYPLIFTVAGLGRARHALSALDTPTAAPAST